MPFRSDSLIGNTEAPDDGDKGRVFDRRRFLTAGAASTAGTILGLERFCRAQSGDSHSTDAQAGLVRFEDEAIAPADVAIGNELDRRLFTDLSRVSARQLVIPTSRFYIRTGASRLLPQSDGWKVTINGLVEGTSELGIHELQRMSRPMGVHLMECAGNVRLTRFGLISVADWSGVHLADVFERARIKTGATRVEVSGFDKYATTSATSIPGAGWMFSTEELAAAGAFLATSMNGQPLTRDHGAPVRLVVPGWYGACCIKWVNRITFVDDEAEATSQMREYAARTLQQGIPGLARDFEPATVDFAAMPVRVEKRLIDGKRAYRVAGVAWGGKQPVSGLQIQFNPEEEFVRVEGFQQSKADPWTIWTHDWFPRVAGIYSIRLAVDPQIRARKLNAGYYVRTVEISEV